MKWRIGNLTKSRLAIIQKKIFKDDKFIIKISKIVTKREHYYRHWKFPENPKEILNVMLCCKLYANQAIKWQTNSAKANILFIRKLCKHSKVHRIGKVGN